jgi:hypothetical protein
MFYLNPQVLLTTKVLSIRHFSEPDFIINERYLIYTFMQKII